MTLFKRAWNRTKIFFKNLLPFRFWWWYDTDGGKELIHQRVATTTNTLWKVTSWVGNKIWAVILLIVGCFFTAYFTSIFN